METKHPSPWDARGTGHVTKDSQRLIQRLVPAWWTGWHSFQWAGTSCLVQSPIRSNYLHSHAQRIRMPSIDYKFINVDPASSQGLQDHLALEKHHRHIRFVHHHLLHHRIPVCETEFGAKRSKFPIHQRLQISDQTYPCQFANQTTHFVACALILSL